MLRVETRQLARGWIKKDSRGFPGGPVVKPSPSNAGDACLNPGQGAKFTHALRPKTRDIKQKQYCNKFNKGFTNGPLQNKSFKKETGSNAKSH